MKTFLHITSGDCSGGNISKCGILGEVFVWHDVLYDGPVRMPGWPDLEALQQRALFLNRETGGGLGLDIIQKTITYQYEKLKSLDTYNETVLWFDACLFDMSMLCHILSCLKSRINPEKLSLLCIDSYPGISPYNGIGQLAPQQLAGEFENRKPVTPELFEYAELVDRAFASQDITLFNTLSAELTPPLKWVPAAISRWLEEIPDSKTRLGKLERLALEAVKSGFSKPIDIFKYVAEKDTKPQYWGDTFLWAKINSLCDKNPSLVKIEGPESRLPQWTENCDISQYRVIFTG
jgi:hypothetical protein